MPSAELSSSFAKKSTSKGPSLVREGGTEGEASPLTTFPTHFAHLRPWSPMSRLAARADWLEEERKWMEEAEMVRPETAAPPRVSSSVTTKHAWIVVTPPSAHAGPSPLSQPPE